MFFFLQFSFHEHHLAQGVPHALPIGEEHNYSEVYGMRLTSADSCPNNGARENCPCVKDDTHRAGVTGWSKIMLNITRLTVNCKYWGSIPENKMLEHYLQLMITPSQDSCMVRLCLMERRGTATVWSTVRRESSASTWHQIVYGRVGERGRSLPEPKLYVLPYWTVEQQFLFMPTGV